MAMLVGQSGLCDECHHQKAKATIHKVNLLTTRQAGMWQSRRLKQLIDNSITNITNNFHQHQPPSDDDRTTSMSPPRRSRGRKPAAARMAQVLFVIQTPVVVREV